MTEEYTDELMLKRRARYQFWTGVLIVILIVITTLGICTLLYAAYVGQQSRDEILSCTRPNGQCYKDNQENTGAVINNIVKETIESAIPLHVQTRRVVVAAAYCAATVESPTVERIQACVDRELKEKP
jgi:hypothetical protein